MKLIYIDIRQSKGIIYHRMTSTTIGGIEVLFREANSDFTKRWLQFSQSKEILPKGWQEAEGRMRVR
jgi:hypothetical protein